MSDNLQLHRSLKPNSAESRYLGIDIFKHQAMWNVTETSFVPISSLLFYLLFIENWIISFPVCEYNKSEKAYLGFREDREFILSARKLSPTLILLLKFALLSQLKIVIGSERDLVVSCVSDTILCHVLNTPFYSFIL